MGSLQPEEAKIFYRHRGKDSVFKAPRGTRDIQPDEQPYWRYIENRASKIARLYGFKRLDTPVFEDSGLFSRSVGAGTDIMDKETYTFNDRGNDPLTLRPEGTAPVCRAYLEHGMQNLPQPVRLYYFCPVFRYDRPQAGRYREHHQFGVEVIGDSDPMVDMEVVQIGWDLMDGLGLKGLSLSLNSIGDKKCRPHYIKELQRYYKRYIGQLCKDCIQRLDNNPLRVLDCKQASCAPLRDTAPASTDHLCDECQIHWDRLCKYLEISGIPFEVDHKLVRGLDYYTRMVFEITPPEEGAQSTILGGGRYDGLIEELGGKSIPGVGFATGMERLILNIERQNIDVIVDEDPEYFLASMDEKSAELAVMLGVKIRESGCSAIQGQQGRGLRGQMCTANTLNAKRVIIIGENEITNGSLTIRKMTNGDQETVMVDDFLAAL
mgnify:FL=1